MPTYRSDQPSYDGQYSMEDLLGYIRENFDAIVSGSVTLVGYATLAGVQTFTGAKTFSAATAFGSTTSHAGAATFASTVNVTGVATLASATISGAATVGTTLGVAGAASFSTIGTSGLATLASASITGAATVGTTLLVTGAATFSVGIVSTSGASALSTAFGAWLQAKNSSNVYESWAYPRDGSNKLLLLGGAGGTTISANSIDAVVISNTGAVTLPLSLAVTGAATVGGTLGVTGLTTLSSALTVNAATQINGAFGITGAGTFASTISTGAATLASASITGTLAVTGGSVLTGNVGIGGAPTYKLDVFGQILRLYNAASSAILFLQPSGSTAAVHTILGDASTYGYIYGRADSSGTNASGVAGAFYIYSYAAGGPVLIVSPAGAATFGGTLAVTGNTSFAATLTVGGGVQATKKTAALTSGSLLLTTADFLAIGAPGAIFPVEFDLPAAASCAGQIYVIANTTGTHDVNIDPSGAETIDGASVLTLVTRKAVILVSTGTEWVSIV